MIFSMKYFGVEIEHKKVREKRNKFLWEETILKILGLFLERLFMYK
jgi:hypothetical protein